MTFKFTFRVDPLGDDSPVHRYGQSGPRKLNRRGQLVMPLKRQPAAG
jgi:hypothetical protein